MPESQSLHSFRRDLISQFLASSSTSTTPGFHLLAEGGGGGGGGLLNLQDLPPRIAGEFGAAVAAEHGRLAQHGGERDRKIES